MKCFLLFLFLFVFSMALFSAEATHEELRLFRTEIIEAFNQKDINKMVSMMHKDIVVNWLNGEVSVGPKAVKEYYDRMMTGPNKIVDSLKVNLIPSALSTLYNNDNTAIVYGISKDSYQLTSGMKFDIELKWSATLVKENDKWLLSSFHGSVNMFDNPLLDKAKKLAYLWVAIGAIGGLLLGMLIFKRKAKKIN